MSSLVIKRIMPWIHTYPDSGNVTVLFDGCKPTEISTKHKVKGLLKLAKFQTKKVHFDRIVIDSLGRSYSQKNFRKYTKYLWESFFSLVITFYAKINQIPIILVDTSDDLSFHPVNKRLVLAASKIYKRELPTDSYLALESFRGSLRHTTRVFRSNPINISIIDKLNTISIGCRDLEPSQPLISFEAKKWDVFYVGNDTFKPLRKGIKNTLQQLENLGLKIFYSEQNLPQEAYFDTIAKSTFVLSPPGLGWDCHRNYEAALGGALPLMQTPWIQVHHPFDERLYYNQITDLLTLIPSLLNNPDLIKTLLNDTHKNAVTYHTHHALVTQVTN